MDRLPDSCFLQIFQMLHPMDINSISTVTKRFWYIIRSTRSIFRLVDFSEAEERMTVIPTAGVWHNLKYVKCLSLRCCVGVVSFSAIQEMKALSIIDFYCTQVRDEVLCALTQKLKGVDVSYCERVTTDGLLRFLGQQSQLEHVGLAGLKNKISNEVLHALSTCDMKYIDISECSITGSLRNFFIDKSKLWELSLQGTGLTETLQVLNVLSVTALRVLEIGPIPEILFEHEEEAVDDILNVLESFKGLRILSLINCNIRNTTNDAFQHLSYNVKIYLWQCHQHLIKCIKKSANQNISYEINPYSQLSKILYITEGK